MQKHFKQPIRCIVLVRDLLRRTGFLYKMVRNMNQQHFLIKYTTLDEKLSQIMRKNGAVAKGVNIYSIFIKTS